MARAGADITWGWCSVALKILSLCDRTGNMVRPWLEAGHEAVTVDLQPAAWEHPKRRHILADVTKLRLLEQFDFVAAFPPCTHLAVSGARWFKVKGLPCLIEALSVVNACRELCEASNAPFLIENPVSTLASYWRKPDYTFDPCDYAGYLPDPAAEAYTKKTCLWTGSGFVMPEPMRVEPMLGSKMHRLPPSEDRADLRSVTPLGFAAAVFAENAHVR